MTIKSKFGRAALAYADQFGRWVVLGPAESRRNRRYYQCRCVCGTERAVCATDLRSGTSTSCGCGTRDAAASANRKHGCSGRRVPEYRIWKGMLARCYTKTAAHFDRYGGRGIAVCDEWRSDFSRFLADMGPMPIPGLTIERKDNNGHYAPPNCVWATRKQQARNTSRARLLTANGKTMCLQDWADRLGVRPPCILGRIARGWDVARAVTERPC